MLENLVNSTNVSKALFVMGVGIGGVFIVLVLFFFMIKLLARIFPDKSEPEKAE